VDTVEPNDEADHNEEPNEDEGSSIDLPALGSQAMQLVKEQATQHPLRTLGIAMGVGYVLGGGVPKLVVRLGMLAAGRALSQAVTVEGARAVAGLLHMRGADELGGEPEPDAVDIDPAQAGSEPRRNGHRRRRGGQARAASEA
jgi:hypothetical protein